MNCYAYPSESLDLDASQVFELSLIHLDGSLVSDMCRSEDMY